MGENKPQELSYTLTYDDLLRSMLEHLYPVVPHDVSGTILLLEAKPNPLKDITQNSQRICPSCKLFLKTHRPLTPKLQDEIQKQMLARLSYLNGQDLSDSFLTLHYLNSIEDKYKEEFLDTLGSLLLVPLVNSPYADNRIIGLLFVGTEQTEQFNEEQIKLLYHLASSTSVSIQQLRSFFTCQELHDLETILAHLPEGVILLDCDHRIISANPAACNYLELLAQIDANNVLQLLGGKSLEQLKSCYRNEPHCPEVTPINHPEMVMEVIIEPVVLEMQSSCWLVLIRDISERKRVEAEIRKALEKERELNVLKTRLVRNISHEYRTPLSTILLAVDTLTKYNDRLTQEQQFSILQRMQNAAKQMADMIDDILLSNQIESGKFAFQPTSLNIVQFCEQLLDDIKVLANHRHKVTFCHRGDVINVQMDATLVRQILTNLLTNAIKYSPEGGSVNLQLSCGNGKAVFQIQDQGIGILVEDQSKIFESFYRGNNVDTISGTGLGLAIVKKAVELHGGEIRFQSEVGVGTTFTVKLPC